MNRKSCPRLIIRLSLAFVVVLALASVASASWKEKVLYSFRGVPDGATPAGGVVFDPAGSLYGATTNGGSSTCHSVAQCGTVFQLAPPLKQGGRWRETVLYVFKGNTSNDGATPVGGVVIDSTGNLYGTTAYGGTGNCRVLGGLMGCGTVYKLSPPKQKGGPWTETVLYSFQGGNDGDFPSGDLVFDTAGNLYGATLFGGGKGTTCNTIYGFCGTLFELSPPKKKGGAWTEKVLHRFAGGTDGASPNGGLVLDSKGAIYGTTHYGGGSSTCNTNDSAGCGTAFRLNQPTTKGGTWRETILHRFKDGNDGAGPNGGLIFDAKGALYGTAGGGGAGNGFGVAFRLADEGGRWTETVLYNFQGGKDGRDPSGPIAFDASGNIYGTTNAEGLYFGGTFFQLKPPKVRGDKWGFGLLYSFMGPPDAEFPAARLIFDKAGTIYSSTQNGGTGQACQGGCGTLFEVWR